MPFVSPGSSPPAPTPWGLALAATSVLLVGGGSIIWAHRDPPAPEFGVTTIVPAGTSRRPPPPIEDEVADAPAVGASCVAPVTSRVSPGGLHSVAYAVEHGARVVKIRVVPDGDELVIAAATGRLIETRPSRPAGAPPVGRFAAP